MRDCIGYLSLCGLLLLSSCSKKESVTAPETSKVAGQWLLVSVSNADGSSVSLSANDSIKVIFSDTGSVVGIASSQCGNRFTGKYEVTEGSQIKFTALSSTEAACTNSVYWQAYDVVGNASRYEQSISLTIYDSRSASSIRFNRIQ